MQKSKSNQVCKQIIIFVLFLNCLFWLFLWSGSWCRLLGPRSCLSVTVVWWELNIWLPWYRQWLTVSCIDIFTQARSCGQTLTKWRRVFCRSIWMRFPSTGVHNVYLLTPTYLLLCRIVRIEEIDHAWFDTVLRSLTANIKYNCAIRLLNLITIEYWHI